MKHIKIVTAAIMIFHFSSATSEVSNSIQNSLIDLSGLSAITNTPKLETTKQRNQFFDNYSVLSIPDINIVDQVQLQNIQTFAPSHRQISLDGLNKIKAITTGLTTQGPEDFKGIKIQNGKITVADMDSKSQGVKDIVGAANTVLQEVKSLNQKELNSLKLTISDMKNMQRIMPIIQQHFDTPIAKDGKVNGISIDVNAMNAEIDSAKKEMATLWPKLTFADFHQLVNVSTSSNGKLIMPNYNKATASESLNKVIEITNQISKYADAGLLSTNVAAPAPGGMVAFRISSNAFVMKGVDTITGKTNGFLNVVPGLGSVATSFQGVNTSNPMLGSARPVFNWVNQTPELLTQTMGTTSLGSINNGNSVASIGGGTSAFEYMNNTNFVTIDNLQNAPLSICISCDNDLGGLCGVGSVCRQKLSMGDLNGAFDEILENLPEGVTLR